jgi:hypothetical protein
MKLGNLTVFAQSIKAHLGRKRDQQNTSVASGVQDPYLKLMQCLL